MGSIFTTTGCGPALGPVGVECCEGGMGSVFAGRVCAGSCFVTVWLGGFGASAGSFGVTAALSHGCTPRPEWSGESQFAKSAVSCLR